VSHRTLRTSLTLVLCAIVFVAIVPASDPPPRPARPNVLLVTVDTLRADHMSGYGYERPTTPHLDAWMARGVRFRQARTIEPLTAPALTSMLTSTEPQDHGASRNGLRMRPGLASLPKTLQAHGYRTAALVGNWTLRHKLTGLGEHFESYEELLTHKRWFGLVNGEADGDDVTDAAIAWIDGSPSAAHQPFFLWVHYVEPHAPYVLHPEHRERLGLPQGDLSRQDRYDTEIAFVDAAIGRLLDHLETSGLATRTVVVFAADHGESLGEHGYWGHGRNLYEPALRIPLALGWAGRMRPRVLDAPALLTDVAPTILGLVGVAAPPSFRGFDWTPVLDGEPPPALRVTRYQAHRGVVLGNRRSELIRRSGLLEVGTIRGTVKEIYQVRDQKRERYDLSTDPGEMRSLDAPKSQPSEDVLGWMSTVYAGLGRFDDHAPEPLDPEAAARMRSLGYVD
jgi:arylsulfatase A-like enzyme